MAVKRACLDRAMYPERVFQRHLNVTLARHARKLAQKQTFVLNVLKYMNCKDRIKAIVGKRQLVTIEFLDRFKSIQFSLSDSLYPRVRNFSCMQFGRHSPFFNLG